MNRILVLAIVLCALEIGCGRAIDPELERLAPDVAPGTVLVEVVHDDDGEEKLTVYAVTPTEASVRSVSDAEHPAPPDTQLPASGRCQSRVEVKSPTGNRSARCEHPGGAFDPDELVLSQLGSRKELYRWKPEHWRGIQGMLWAPNGRSLGILNISSSWGLGPFEILHALGGHPVPHDNVFVDFVDVETKESTEYLVARDVVRSRTRLSVWR